MRKILKTSKFTKDLGKLEYKVQIKAFETSKKLSVDLFDNSLKIKKLIGYTGIFRVVILNNYRMIYSFDDESLFLLRILHRKDIYKKFKF